MPWGQRWSITSCMDIWYTQGVDETFSHSGFPNLRQDVSLKAGSQRVIWIQGPCWLSVLPLPQAHHYVSPNLNQEEDMRRPRRLTCKKVLVQHNSPRTRREDETGESGWHMWGRTFPAEWVPHLKHGPIRLHHWLLRGRWLHCRNHFCFLQGPAGADRL